MLRKTHNPQLLLQLALIVASIAMILLISGIVVSQLNLLVKETLPIILGCTITVSVVMALLYTILDVMYHKPEGHYLNEHCK
jgi:uncharacterized protein with PQ loop repeat